MATDAIRAHTMAQHSNHETQVTTDHAAILRWAEARGGKPAAVKATQRKDDPGILRIIFPQSRFADDDSLEEISWNEFFEKFDEADLALVYQEETARGERSLFNKLVARTAADARAEGER